MQYELPIPFGWYCVAIGGELAPGDVKPLRYFDRDLVLFRTAAGKAVLLDAFCPHLGAHLGVGGSVEGENIACPFHGWQYNSEGVCTSVPYASRIPPKIEGKPVIHSYPVTECNGLVWGWYHPENIDPLFEVEVVRELDSDTWSDLDCYDWEINTHPQETGENAVDTAHFIYVHSMANLPEGEITVEGHTRNTEITMKSPAMNPETGEVDLQGEEVTHGHLITRSIGPGQTVQYLKTYFDTIMIGTITPINDQRLQLRFCFSQPMGASEEQRTIAQGQVDTVVSQVAQDIIIWENKRYQDNPILCDRDGPINKYRKWYSQFYADSR
jgi:3-ketosteroid 9alpha-monooxygenase subunit A